MVITLRRFSWQLGLSFLPCGSRSHLSLMPADLPASTAYLLLPGLPTPGPPILLRLSFVSPSSTRNINSFPISYAFQPCLRGRLTLGRLPLPRKPWVYGEQVFRLFYRYSCQHNHFPAVHMSFRTSFILTGNAPLPPNIRLIRSFGSMLSPVTFSAQRH